MAQNVHYRHESMKHTRKNCGGEAKIETKRLMGFFCEKLVVHECFYMDLLILRRNFRAVRSLHALPFLKKSLFLNSKYLQCQAESNVLRGKW